MKMHICCNTDPPKQHDPYSIIIQQEDDISFAHHEGGEGHITYTIECQECGMKGFIYYNLKCTGVEWTDKSSVWGDTEKYEESE